MAALAISLRWRLTSEHFPKARPFATKPNVPGAYLD